MWITRHLSLFVDKKEALATELMWVPVQSLRFWTADTGCQSVFASESENDLIKTESIVTTCNFILVEL